MQFLLRLQFILESRLLSGEEKKPFQNDVGQGFCALFGEKIIQKKCLNCDPISK